MSKYHIPDELIPAAYDLTKRVLEGKLTTQEGVDRLSKEGMVRGSASIYITVYQQLIQGKKITYTLNALSITYCLKQILKDYGPIRLSKTLSTLKEHIDYCEKRHNSKMETLRIVYDQFFKKP